MAARIGYPVWLGMGDAKMDGSWITSAGIDIGTSTTKLIVSRLKLVRTSSALSLPRYEIAERELMYASPIHATPLTGADQIDADRVWAIVSGELDKAEVGKGDLKSGAVIITGETATKTNARAIVHRLADRAGDFVVAAAGADLEAYLAGKGAGADRRSLRIRGAVVNIDIGGGTANAAIFRRGKLIGTITFHIGGRLIQLDETGMIRYVAPSIRTWLGANGYRIEAGIVVAFSMIKDICYALSREMLRYFIGGNVALTDWHRNNNGLIAGQSLEQVPEIEEWMVSGGIGKLIQERAAPANLAEMAIHHDIGPLLASALRDCMQASSLRVVDADETVRATVIGAGMQSMEIGGATVHLDPKLLPIRNLPVLKLELSAANEGREEVVRLEAVRLEAELEDTLRTAFNLFDPEAVPPFALAITGTRTMNYAFLQHLADRLESRFTHYFPRSGIMVVVCERDIAQALGQALQRRCEKRLKVICIDQIRVEHGDYIDLGEPVSGMMIPVVVKTLAFPNGAR
ncbi:ethanolamine ammonia-lyase reactivating factor EutA [Cohnella mopanensis]|uniref:ethanolamine ammonia-lyase reactivating factor EutA n=1 Tax=Cohnella mopanensis TaxID=2911966 RepID=UPI001EF9ADCD|nr:ethanolamine ammonia-lyase reactivating factor EutA [Cohnella mopanensis]